MKSFSVFALALAFNLPLSACASPSEPASRHVRHIQQVAVLLDIITPAGRGHCSGTAVAPQVVLTATHCFNGELTRLTVNGQEVSVTKRLDDGADHTLVVLDKPVFKHHVGVDVRRLRMGEEASMLGNPGPFKAMFRRGLVSGVDNLETPVPGVALLDIQIFGGDSGSGVFDARGRLVGVVSYVRNAVDPRSLNQVAFGGVMPFAFTRSQWAEAGVSTRVFVQLKD